MLSICLYLTLLVVLIYWIESSIPLMPNSLNLNKNPAESLENWLKQFNWSSRHEPMVHGRLPQYKFYSEVVEVLLNLARKIGGSYQDSIIFLREGLQADRQFEKKLKEMLLGTWLQMLLMVALTWIFIIAALMIVDVSLSAWKLLLIAFWQGIGLGLMPLILRHFRQKFFADIGKLWKMLYVLRSLSKVPLSRTEIFTISGITELTKIKQKSLFHIVEKLKETCQRALQMGGSYEEEVLSLMAELRFQEKWHFELFEKRLTVIKLGLMAIFFLPSYLAFIFLLLGDLLSVM